MKLRPITPGDLDFVRDMLYIALWDPPDKPRRPRDVLEKPHIRRLVEGWGRPDDVGFIAEIGGEAAGAAWCRSGGSITVENAHLPELGIGVRDEFQGRGIGTALLASVIESVRESTGHRGIRLGVHPRNEIAIRLYEKFGFRTYARPEGQYPQMVLKFDAPA